MKGKIVRDKIPLQVPGQYRKCTSDEEILYLARKLVEEGIEFLISLDPVELADVYEVLYEITKRINVDIGELRKQKASEKGNMVNLWCTEEQP
ncbi:hypothetical protein EYM_07580 [Ignicoccus islandicus DSM 13165]|uniref:Phosphoribosyl-ATP pyrophosphohydrolase n=1 Tax=Ignicoccus islandicus DSM 13165 TaxID=940295 RepID=A0A0U3G169_9CREN|nr:hypothetical protein [Ignicoccus islandicus]ALU12060.1 hypothetical protein EYM_07580 [Ignicoccus islandicus DSM 13165]